MRLHYFTTILIVFLCRLQGVTLASASGSFFAGLLLILNNKKENLKKGFYCKVTKIKILWQDVNLQNNLMFINAKKIIKYIVTSWNTYIVHSLVTLVFMINHYRIFIVLSYMFCKENSKAFFYGLIFLIL